MLPHRLLLLTLTLAGVVSAQNRYYIPEMVDGNAVAHNERARARSRFLNLRTTFVLVNTGTTDANVTIAASHDDSTPRHLTIPGLGSGTSLSFTLGPGATRLLVTDGSGDGSEGAATITSDSVLNVSEILSSTNLGDPVSESAVPAIGDKELVTASTIPVDTAAGIDTGVALYNPGTDGAMITAQLLDVNGAAVHSVTITLDGGHHTTLFATSGLHAPAGFQGSIAVSSTVNLAAVAVRRSTASPAYTLIAATSQNSRRLNFLLPGIADGHSDSSSSRTTFQLTNLSTTAASVKFALTRDDGSAFRVTIPGAGSRDTFSAQLAPGASLFWRTDGSTAGVTSGAAAISSDQPLAAIAVISKTDSSGFVHETNLTPAETFFQLLLPFDNASKTTAGVRFYNAGSKPVSLTLQLSDRNGKSLATKTLNPMASGTATAWKVADLFAGVPASGGAITVSSTDPRAVFVSALALRQTSNGELLSSAPAVILFGNRSGITPTTVTPTLDMANQATATIPSIGGSLSVTDSKGNKFTLTIPQGALLDQATITMTAISSATGLPGQGLLAGVQLEPDGLVLFQPAQLTIELASAAPSGVLPIGWRGSAPGVYVNPVLPSTKSLTVLLDHFSGAGIGEADTTRELLAVDNEMDFITGLLGEDSAIERQQQLMGGAEKDFVRGVADFYVFAYDFTIAPLIKLALDTRDTDVMRCAIKYAYAYSRQASLLGLLPDPEFPD